LRDGAWSLAGLKARKARAEGAYQEHVKRLKAEYGVGTVKEAEALLEEYKDKELRLARKYLKAKKTFEAELASDKAPPALAEDIKEYRRREQDDD
jgi:hypothetical protein